MTHDTRLATVTGPGGTGKSRLALQVGMELLPEFADGVYFVSLATIREPGLVVDAIAQSLGVTEEGTRPLIESLKENLRPKQALLLLDNFEQVLPAAGQVAALLTACPLLRVLVTSRELLRIRGEHEFHLSPLALPPLRQGSRGEDGSPRDPRPATLMQYASVALFVERATAAKSDFEINDENAGAVAEICVRLDGLPLAIELAAARVKLLPPQAMLSRLENRLKLLTGGARDLPERHRTLRGAIDWSHDLLSPEEQALFRRLAVFAGSFTLETAEAVCSDDERPTTNDQRRTDDGSADVGRSSFVIGRDDVLDGLGSLVDKSLVRRRDTEEGEPRFFLWGTIREYALDRMVEHGELEALQSAHAAHYLALAEEAEPRLRGREQAEWLSRLEQEHDNLRAALDWGVSAGESEEGRKGGRAGEAERGREGGRAGAREGARERGSDSMDVSPPRSLPPSLPPSLAPSLAPSLPSSLPHSPAEAALCLGAALWRFWHVRGYPREGRERLETALALPGAAARTVSRARALNGAGALAHDQGEYAIARALLEEALGIAREVNAGEPMATALNNLGHVALDQGGDEEATEHYQQALALWRELGNKQGIAMVVHNLGSVALDRGDYVSAAAYFDESLALKRLSGDQRGIATSLNNLGMVVAAQGAHERAASLLNESLRLFQQLGDNYGIAMSLHNVADLVSEQGNLTRAAALHRRCLQHCTKLQNRQAIAASLEGLAGVIAAQEHPLTAARLYGAAEAMREALGAPIPDNERAVYDRKVAAARARADVPAWDNAWQAGRAMPLAEVLALATGELAHEPEAVEVGR